MCVLMSGPTGVGKATVAKAVARACRVHLIQVSTVFLIILSMFDHMIPTI